jgi:hypothetical protein
MLEKRASEIYPSSLIAEKHLYYGINMCVVVNVLHSKHGLPFA